MPDLPDITAQTQSMTTHPRGTEVQVRVEGPKAAPDFTKELRARARAMVSVGVINTVSETLSGVTAGEIDRFTETVNDPVVRSIGTLMEERLYTVVVHAE